MPCDGDGDGGDQSLYLPRYLRETEGQEEDG